MKIPYDLDEEMQVYSGKVDGGVNSLFEFTTIKHANFGALQSQTVPVDKSYEWRMIFFPAQMMHQVYPFYSSDDFRVSISGNVFLSIRNKKMKCEVTLFKVGTVFKEEVIARDYEDAKRVALARNPGATIVSVTAKF